MRTAVLLAALLIGAAALVATAPSEDAESPDWMEPMVEAGRASLLEHLDLIKPGSPLVLVSTQCREDGAVRVMYENRYLWVFHRGYYAEAPPGWVSGSMAGGVLHESDDWLAGHAEVPCDDPAASTGPLVRGWN